MQNINDGYDSKLSNLHWTVFFWKLHCFKRDQNNRGQFGENRWIGFCWLHSIELPEFVGKWVFAYCMALEKLIVPSQLTVIKESTFRCFSALKERGIPAKVEVMENSTDKSDISWIVDKNWNWVVQRMHFTQKFSCSFKSDIYQMTLPSSVSSVGTMAFSGCTELLKWSILAS